MVTLFWLALVVLVAFGLLLAVVRWLIRGLDQFDTYPELREREIVWPDAPARERER